MSGLLNHFDQLQMQQHYVCTAHVTSDKSFTAGIQGQLKGPGSPTILDALSC